MTARTGRPDAGEVDFDRDLNLVEDLKERSGLSWEQLSKLFGVSRRSMHKWARGGAMNARDLDRAAEIGEALSKIPGTPFDVRTALFRADGSGNSIYRTLMRSLTNQRANNGDDLSYHFGIVDGSYQSGSER